MSDIEKKNWEALRSLVEKLNAEKATMQVEFEGLRTQMAELVRRNSDLEQRVQNMQIKVITLTGGYRGT